jgi:hypothetical protein
MQRCWLAMFSSASASLYRLNTGGHVKEGHIKVYVPIRSLRVTKVTTDCTAKYVLMERFALQDLLQTKPWQAHLLGGYQWCPHEFTEICRHYFRGYALQDIT